MSFYVYILRCRDLSYYTGHTDNIEARIGQHEQGSIKTCYTYTKRPVYVVYVAEFASRGEAIEAEQQIKGWTRKKKEALINENFERLKQLSKRIFNKPAQNLTKR